MSVIHAPKENPVTSRHLVIPGLLLMGLLGFLVQLWVLQVVRSEELSEQAKMTGQIENKSLAPRGKILARDGTVLADVRPKIVVTVKPAQVAQDETLLPRLAAVLGVPVKKLDRAVKQQWNKGNLPVPVFVGATVQQGAKISESGDALSGVGVETLPMRFYKEPQALAHALGWVAIPDANIEEDLKEKGITDIPKYVGRDGVERRYEEVLMGKPGLQVYTVDSRRRPMRTVMSEVAQPGASVVLGIDLKTQRAAIEALAGRRGAVVALDPRTGEIIALVSSPNYSLAAFDGGLSTDEAEYLYKNEDRPMLKRFIAGRYPPGSTYKILTTMAAYQAGIFNPGNVVSCPGYLTMGNKRVKCENHPPTSYSFTMAMARSCNTYFGKLAQRTGEEQMRKTAEQVGFGQVTGLDMPGEVKGLVPDPEHILKAHKRRWSIGDTNNVGIGQGDLEVTPLQMACLAAMVANRGVSYRPHLVKSIIPAGENMQAEPVKPQVLAKFDADPSFWDTMHTALRAVVVQGTARRAAIASAEVSGKTGSAENSQSRRTHAWFVGYAPEQNPQIAFAVILETAGHGGEIAAPVAQKMLQAFFSKDAPVAPAQAQNGSTKASRIDVSISPEEAPADRP
ncbi:MAG: penicillin-binding protein 2 [Armatimonadetes bacterium]|nr:penicillin-binding protein 2 [Armatimonadota bacterium]